jgi:hypothetical protein
MSRPSRSRSAASTPPSSRACPEEIYRARDGQVSQPSRVPGGQRGLGGCGRAGSSWRRMWKEEGGGRREEGGGMGLGRPARVWIRFCSVGGGTQKNLDHWMEICGFRYASVW